MKRKRYSKEFKAKVALEALKGQKTANEIASEYEVHVSQINMWKKQLWEAAPEVFGRGQEREAAQREAERDRLFQQIDKLQVEVDCLKKRPDSWTDSGAAAWMHRAESSPVEHQAPVRAHRPVEGELLPRGGHGYGIGGEFGADEAD